MVSKEHDSNTKPGSQSSRYPIERNSLTEIRGYLKNLKAYVKLPRQLPSLKKGI